VKNNQKYKQLSRMAIASILLTSVTFFHFEESEAENSVNDNANLERSNAVSRKIDLLGRLVQNSAAAARIENSNNDDAKALLKQARLEWENAIIKLEVMNIDQAEISAKEGLIIMTRASSAVADTARLKNEQLARYKQLRERIASFTDAFQRIASEKQETISYLLDMENIEKNMNQAEKLAEENNYTEANKLLAEAADSVELALARARHKETLLHELKFNSLEEEFAYEKQRNHSYMLLADLIKKKKKVDKKRLQEFQSRLEENEKMRKKADEMVRNGDIEGAIKVLETGTQNLARTLRASGVVF
jgi:hypothetical protein